MIRTFALACGLSYAAMTVGPTHAANSITSYAAAVRPLGNSGLLPATNTLDFIVYNFGIAPGRGPEMNETAPFIPESAKLALVGAGVVCLVLVRRGKP